MGEGNENYLNSKFIAIYIFTHFLPLLLQSIIRLEMDVFATVCVNVLRTGLTRMLYSVILGGNALCKCKKDALNLFALSKF